VKGNSNEPAALSVVDTSNSAFDTFGFVNLTFCPVTNG
tara:strand:- start:974 stop:1087 length:114 start_codon:yes stop_codon:yes gene_type:complete